MSKKLLFAMAAAGLMSASAANAAPFYLDIGTNYDAPTTAPSLSKVTDTSTSMKDEMLFVYQSSTTIQDTDGSATINAGDKLSTDGGLAVGGLTQNQVTGFTPAPVLGDPSNNGYLNEYLLSFSVSDLQGEVTGINSLPDGDVPLFSYEPGLLKMFLTFDGTTLINFMNIAITGGGATGVSTILTGSADFTDITDFSYANLFRSGTFECEGSNGFYDIWKNCGAGAGEALTIDFFASFDTNIFISDFTYDSTAEEFTLTSNHDGSATFTTVAVPEPASLALLGLGLLGLGAVRRRRSA